MTEETLEVREIRVLRGEVRHLKAALSLAHYAIWSKDFDIGEEMPDLADAMRDVGMNPANGDWTA